MKYRLAIDLGASSGRHIVGYGDGTLRLKEVYRFDNGFVRSPYGLVWDTDKIFAHIKAGIKEAIKVFGRIDSLAIDCFGVDYALLKGDEVVKPHFSYRDSRTREAIERVHKIVHFDDLYRKTGIQYASYNTIYQLYDDLIKGRLSDVTDFLMLPEYFTYLLTGVKKKEYTEATTTGLVNAVTKQFDEEIYEKLGFPNIFSQLCHPGSEVGELKSEIAKEVGGNVNVKLCASHDTACAFEAVDGSVVLSSGTWSLLGAKISAPDTSEKSRLANFSNEGGVGYIRYLKNIMGMWIFNGIVGGRGLSFGDAVKLAERSKCEEIFDVTDDSLVAPDDMEKAVRKLLGNKNLSVGDVLNSVFHSLASCYARCLGQMEDNLGKSFSDITVVGGGAKNELLNNLTERYTHKKVIALPIEATAIGNLKTQIQE